MKTFSLKQKLALAATGAGLLAIGSGWAYWQHRQQQWCVRFTSVGGQEVTYSRGCLPTQQRYKKWTLTASAENHFSLQRL